MKTIYVIFSIFAIAAIALFFVQKKKHSEALTIITAAICGAAVFTLVIGFCVDAIFVRSLFD